MGVVSRCNGPCLLPCTRSLLPLKTSRILCMCTCRSCGACSNHTENPSQWWNWTLWWASVRWTGSSRMRSAPLRRVCGVWRTTRLPRWCWRRVMFVWGWCWTRWVSCDGARHWVPFCCSLFFFFAFIKVDPWKYLLVEYQIWCESVQSVFLGATYE